MAARPRWVTEPQLGQPAGWVSWFGVDGHVLDDLPWTPGVTVAVRRHTDGTIAPMFAGRVHAVLATLRGGILRGLLREELSSMAALLHLTARFGQEGTVLLHRADAILPALAAMGLSAEPE